MEDEAQLTRGCRDVWGAEVSFGIAKNVSGIEGGGRGKKKDLDIYSPRKGGEDALLIVGFCRTTCSSSITTPTTLPPPRRYFSGLRHLKTTCPAGQLGQGYLRKVLGIRGSIFLLNDIFRRGYLQCSTEVELV